MTPDKWCIFSSSSNELTACRCEERIAEGAGKCRRSRIVLLIVFLHCLEGLLTRLRWRDNRWGNVASLNIQCKAKQLEKLRVFIQSSDRELPNESLLPEGVSFGLGCTGASAQPDWRSQRNGYCKLRTKINQTTRLDVGSKHVHT